MTTSDEGPKVVFTTKELLQDMSGKLDKIDEKLDQKADLQRVESMVETVRAQMLSEIARVEALITPLVNPQTGVYRTIADSNKSFDGKTISALCAITLLLLGILLKKYLGLG